MSIHDIVSSQQGLDSSEIRETVRGWIESARAEEGVSASRYWYPLSQPTFDENEIVEALDSMCRFRTSMGEKTARFEAEFSEWVGATDSVMVNSGSSADLLAAYLLNDPRSPMMEPGAEVLVPSVTWPTQIWSILMAGFDARLVDVDPNTLNMDLEDLRSKITAKTKAIFVVHLMGNPMDMDAIMEIAKEHDLIVLEDCCEALGARWRDQAVGTFGLAGTCSFFFSHHMTTMEGGMVYCQDAKVANTLRQMRAHGWVRGDANAPALAAQFRCDPRYLFVNWGFNLRPTEVQAGFGLHQLKRLDDFQESRNHLADHFFNYVDSSPWLQRPQVVQGGTPAWFALPVLVSEHAPFSRDALTAELEGEGVETRAVVTGNLGRQPAVKLFPQLHGGPLPGADRVHDYGLYVGLSPAYRTEDIDRLIDVFTRCVARLERGSVRRAA